MPYTWKGECIVLGHNKQDSFCVTFSQENVIFLRAKQVQLSEEMVHFCYERSFKISRKKGTSDNAGQNFPSLFILSALP